LVGHVSEAITKYRPDAVFVDEGGLGAGVVDRLRQLNFDVVGVNFGAASDRSTDGKMKSANKRSEMWASTSEALKDGLAIPDDDRLAFELLAPSYSFNAKNEIQLEKKEDIKKRGLRSPDIADALALTFAYPVVGRSLLDEQEEREDEEFDPIWGSAG
jgi:hypothetical protein